MSLEPDRPPIALVVDDNALLRMDVVDMLEDAGFEAVEAEDGDAAVLLLERQSEGVTLMFSDVEMPGSRDGFALAREVALRWPSISIVVASGRIRPLEGQMPEGAHFVGKPFSAETLHGHLRQVIPGHRQPGPLRG